MKLVRCLIVQTLRFNLKKTAFSFVYIGSCAVTQQGATKLGDHLQDFHRKPDEYRTSALFALDRLLRSNFVRFQTAMEIYFISRLFHIISRRKVGVNALSTKFKSWRTF